MLGESGGLWLADAVADRPWPGVPGGLVVVDGASETAGVGTDETDGVTEAEGVDMDLRRGLGGAFTVTTPSSYKDSQRVVTRSSPYFLWWHLFLL